MPVTDTCAASCPTLAAEGPLSQLPPPSYGTNSQPAVTFGADSWYVARSNLYGLQTQLHRFSQDRSPLGGGLLITGAALNQIGFKHQGSGELVLLGHTDESDLLMGKVSVVHRFDPTLKPLGAPLVLRSMSAPVKNPIEFAPTGELLMTASIWRPVVLIRHLRIDSSATTPPEPTQLDWHVTEAYGAVVPSPYPAQQVTAMHFVGDTAGVLIEAGLETTFLTRLVCRR